VSSLFYTNENTYFVSYCPSRGTLNVEIHRTKTVKEQLWSPTVYTGFMYTINEEKRGKTKTDRDIPVIFSFSARSIPVCGGHKTFPQYREFPPNPSSHRLAALPKLSMGQASSLIG
jgi:hypothetical protein